MKFFFFFLVLISIVSCCLGTKCKEERFQSRFRIISKSNSTDLVFGSSRIYNQADIKFYSMLGSDTITHAFGVGPNPNPGADSLLFVEFDRRRFENVYLKLNNNDIDTLQLVFKVDNYSDCCPDITSIGAIKHNSAPIDIVFEGIFHIKK